MKILITGGSGFVGSNIAIYLKKKLKIAWDPGNGAMGIIMKGITEKLGNSENIIINEEVDGRFPNHHPDPTVPKNMRQLIEIADQELYATKDRGGNGITTHKIVDQNFG